MAEERFSRKKHDYGSFNLKGEPIVNTPAEALATFGRSGMDVLVLGDSVVEKRASGGSEP